MGGPGFRPFNHVGNGGQNEYFAADLPGPEFSRRTIYRISVHSARDPLLDALDCPEFSTRTAVRPDTTTPLQALSLMNNSMVLRQAERLAATVQAETRADRGRRSIEFWKRVLNRAPRRSGSAGCPRTGAQTGPVAGGLGVGELQRIHVRAMTGKPRQADRSATRRGLAAPDPASGGSHSSLLLHQEARAAGSASPYAPHVTPRRVKRIIHVCALGGVSHVDTFDHKPELIRRHGQDSGPQVRHLLLASRARCWSPFEFRRHGASGRWVSDLSAAPRRAAWMTSAFIHSMRSESSNHTPATFLMNSGFTFNGFPSMGAWISYGLGSENQNFPAYVVLPDPRQLPAGGARSTGPTDSFRPCTRASPSAAAPRTRRLPTSPRRRPSPPAKPPGAAFSLLQSLNESRTPAAHPADSALAARIRAYELAAQMQLSVPELADLRAANREATTHRLRTRSFRMRPHRGLRTELPARPPAERTRRPLRAGVQRRPIRLIRASTGTDTKTSWKTTASRRW
jgi:hypothetical protein